MTNGRSGPHKGSKPSPPKSEAQTKEPKPAQKPAKA